MAELNLLLENKKDLVSHLNDILTEPLLVEFQKIYDETRKQLSMNDSNAKLLKQYQECLTHIPEWTKQEKNLFYVNIVKKTGISYIGELIKAIIVNQIKIIIKTEDSSLEIPKMKFYIPSAENFIHMCLVTTARAIWKQTYLMYHNVRSVEKQHNISQIETIIHKSMNTVVRTYIPLDILFKYIKDNSLTNIDQESDEEITIQEKVDENNDDDEDEDDDDEEDEDDENDDEEEDEDNEDENDDEEEDEDNKDDEEDEEEDEDNEDDEEDEEDKEDEEDEENEDNEDDEEDKKNEDNEDDEDDEKNENNDEDDEDENNDKTEDDNEENENKEDIEQEDNTNDDNETAVEVYEPVEVIEPLQTNESIETIEEQNIEIDTLEELEKTLENNIKNLEMSFKEESVGEDNIEQPIQLIQPLQIKPISIRNRIQPKQNSSSLKKRDAFF